VTILHTQLQFHDLREILFLRENRAFKLVIWKIATSKPSTVLATDEQFLSIHWQLELQLQTTFY